jgi:TonB-linked SusC/RagA family outer membrane protein
MALILCWYCQVKAQSQFNNSTVEITGEVLSESNETMVGVNVILKGTKQGTTTDSEGKFYLVIPEDHAETGVLIFSFIGYASEDYAIDGKRHFKVMLYPDIITLQETVVVGYGTVKKSDITGSVVSVREKDFNQGPILSVNSQLQNTAPGVVMTQTSAQPGGNFNVQVRGQTSILGSNQPLYVIDGLPIVNSEVTPESTSNFRSSPSRNPLNGINPQDISSIEVLKDASAAAIYGARGANGVVLITTKRGQNGSHLSYEGSYSIQKVNGVYDILSAVEYANVSNEFSRFLGQDVLYSQAEINQFKSIPPVSDYFVQTGAIDRHQLSINGANDKINYYISANYFGQDGIIKNSGLKRYASRVNIDGNISKKLKIGTTITASESKDIQIHFGDGGRGGEANGIFDGILEWTPIQPLFQPDGSYSPHPIRPTQDANPASILDIKDNLISKRILGSLFGEFEIIEGLKARLNLGIDDISSKRSAYIPTSTLRGKQVNGEGEISHNSSQNLLSEFTLNYTKKVKGNPLTTLVGYTYQTASSDGISVSAVGFPSEVTNINDISSASIFFPPTSFKNESKLISYIGRANYNLADKYLFTATIRADGSTKFGPSNKWGYFPSTAFAWKIHNEKFFNSSVVNDLKFRLSWGQTGNQEIGNKLSQSLFGSTRNFVLGTDEHRAIGFAATRPANENLKWETSSQTNIGIDASFMDARIQAFFDVYRKITNDVLLTFALPGTSGFESITTNAGALQNHGVELQLRTINKTSPLEWSTSINLAYNQNRWKDRGGLPYPSYEQEFGPVGGLYSYVVQGIFQEGDDIASGAQPGALPGQFKFQDTNDDGLITPEDRVFIGKNQPDFTFGINNSINYKRWDLNLFLQGVYGIYKYNSVMAGLNSMDGILLGLNKSVNVLKRWTPENQSDQYPSGIPNATGDDYFNSLYVENASFLKLRNVTIGYSIKPTRTFSAMRVYFDTQNLFMITKWTGLDPETFGPGKETGTSPEYPNARTFTLGVNAKF